MRVHLHQSDPHTHPVVARAIQSLAYAWHRALALDGIEIGWLISTLAIPLLFTPLESNAFDLPKAALLKAMVLLMGVVVLARISEQGTGFFVENRSLVLSTLALGSVLILATLFSTHPLISLLGGYARQQGLLTQLAYLALFLMTAIFLRTHAQADRLWRVLVWGSVPIIVYAFLQGLQLDPFDWRSDSALPIVATLGRSNFVGTYLAMILPLTIARLAMSARKTIYILMALAQLLCLTFTLARGAWLGALGAMFVMALLWAMATRRKRIVLALFAVCVCAILPAFVLPIPGLERIANEGSTAARLTIWQTTVSLIAARPLLGYGPETMQFDFVRIFPPQLVYYQGKQFAVDRAHNVWFDLAMSAGILGVVAFVVLLLIVARQVWRRWHLISEPFPSSLSFRTEREIAQHSWEISRQHKPPPRNDNRKDYSASWERWLVIALIASLAGHLIDLEFGFDVIATATVFWLLLALLAAVGRGLNESLPSASSITWRERLPFALPAIGVLLVIATICARPVFADIAFRNSQIESNTPAYRIASGEQAVQLWSVETEYHMGLAKLYAHVGAIEKAETELRTAEQLVPDDSRIAATRGDIYARLGGIDPRFYAQAEIAYRRAIAIAPNIATYHAALGWTLAQQQLREQAIAELERAVALDATDGSAFQLLGDLYKSVGREADATRAWKEAVRWSER